MTPGHTVRVALFLGASASATGAQVAPIDFARDVRPILAARCYTCHGPDEGAREARLRLDTAEGLAKQLGSDHLVLAGSPEESELFLRVTDEDPDWRMPPAETGPPLDEAEVDVLRRWIEEGAAWSSHWAFAPSREVAPPEVEDDSWPRNPIDAFVLARLEAENLSPAPEADRRTLLRRVTLDLVGMTPTVEELEAFLADDAPGAYERVVERLIASPHYAERQARHWLDLARYADSHGFTIDGSRSMWPWRDWVVNAIDSGMPYDQFTVEQLAGDLLPDATNAQLVATGFQRNTQINQEGGAKDEENRVNAVFDRVETTGAVWLGSTLSCARCHSHKYDPVTQTEYYQLFAFYNQTEDGGVSSEPSVLVTDDESQRAVDEFDAERARLEAELVRVELAARAGWTTWIPARATGSNGPELRVGEDASIRSIGHSPQTSDYVLDGPAPAAGVAALRLEALPHASLPKGGPGRSGSGNFVLERVRLYARRVASEEPSEFTELELARASADYSQGFGPEGGNPYPVQAALEDEAKQGWAVQPRFGRPHVAHFELAEPLPAGSWELRVVLEQNWGSGHVLGRFRLALATAQEPVPEASVPGEWTDAWDALVAQRATRPELPSSLVLRERVVPRPNHLFRRGDFLDPGPQVVPGYPAAMNHFARDARPKDRLDLARWLVDPRNALVQRVTVNRWWQRYFGLGLVETENDLGIRGADPSHPDLLEWLARELVAREFSMKAVHRLIVTSATYRQSSRPRAELATRDPNNRLLARQSRLRIEAECIRDSALRASGLLSTKRGGPPLQPPQPDGVFAFTQSSRSWKASQGEDRFRRSLYTRLWRAATYPFHLTFDAPAANVTCTRRGRSSTPLQALTLANDPMVLEIAAGLGERLAASEEAGGGALGLGFELCLARQPSPRERALLESLWAKQERRELDAGLDAAAARRGAWTAVARVLFNLDEFVTRE